MQNGMNVSAKNRCDELDGVINARNGLERVEHRRRSRAKQLRRAARDQLTIRQFDGDGGLARALGHGHGGGHDGAAFRLDIQRAHQQLDLIHFALRILSLTDAAGLFL